RIFWGCPKLEAWQCIRSRGDHPERYPGDSPQAVPSGLRSTHHRDGLKTISDGSVENKAAEWTRCPLRRFDLVVGVRCSLLSDVRSPCLRGRANPNRP